MSYTKNTWATGDTITAEKLNAMETGIEAANDPYPGYDVVLRLNDGLDSVSLVKGDMTNACEKARNSQGVSLLVYAEEGTAGEGRGATLLSYFQELGFYGDAEYASVRALYNIASSSWTVKNLAWDGSNWTVR